MAHPLIYLAFHKPYGVLSTFTDPANRPTLKSYIPITDVYAAGRLDMDSEGLLLLTNDGKLIRNLTDPRFHLSKTYYALVEGEITSKALERLRQGVHIPGILTLPCQARLITDPKYPERSKPPTPHKATSWIEIKITEGKKRQIRHMTAAVGFPTLRLIRVAIGPLRLGSLTNGEWRYLDTNETKALQQISSRS